MPTAFSESGTVSLGASSTKNETYHFLVADLLMVSLLMVPSTFLCNQTFKISDLGKMQNVILERETALRIR